MRWLVAWILLLPVAGAAPMLTAVVPDLPGPGPDDEAFAVGAPQAHDLSGWSVTDGEAAWTFPHGTRLQPGTEAWFAADLDTWKGFGMPDAVAWSGLRLSNDGDELLLVDPAGNVVDAFAWGEGGTEHIEGSVSYRSPGLVYRRLPDARGWVDTDAAADWQTPRAHRVGQSSLDAPEWDVARMTLYSSPDATHAVLTSLVSEAQTRVALHVYELRSPTLADALVAAAARGARVDVLVTASPVGMDTAERSETAWALQRIQDAGGHAWLAGTQRYRFHHLKVLVADTAVAVQSENWVPSGVPEDPSWGNRGWGIVLHGPEPADWFAAWMEQDREAWDTLPFQLGTFDPFHRQPVRLPPRAGTHGPLVPPLALEGPVLVRPVVAPDHTGDPAADPIAAVAAAARERLWVQQLDLAVAGSNRLGWRGPDPLAEAIAAAAGQGADVRVHLAAPFAADDTGNAETLRWLEGQGPVLARQEGRDAVNRWATLHNKGLVADGSVVLGSINGNHHSRTENREVSLIVHHDAAADWYGALFLGDWGGAGGAPDPLHIDAPGGAVFPLVLVAALLAAGRCGSTPSPGSPWRSSRPPS